MSTKSNTTKQTDIVQINPVFKDDWKQYENFDVFFLLFKRYSNRLMLSSDTDHNVVYGQTATKFITTVSMGELSIPNMDATSSGLPFGWTIDPTTGDKIGDSREIQTWLTEYYKANPQNKMWCTAWSMLAPFNANMGGSKLLTAHNSTRAITGLLLKREFGVTLSNIRLYDRQNKLYDITETEVLEYLEVLSPLLASFERVWIKSKNMQLTSPDRKTRGGNHSRRELPDMKPNKDGIIDW